MTWVPVAALVVSITSMVLGAYLTITLHRMNSSQRKREREEDQRRQEFADMLAQRSEAFNRADEDRKQQLAEAKSELSRKGAELHEANGKLVDERIRGWTHDVAERMQPLLSTLDLVQKRLNVSEADLDKLGESGHRNEITLVAKMDQLKDYIRETAASKKDLEKHEQSVERKFSHLDQAVAGLSREVGVLAACVERQPRQPANK